MKKIFYILCSILAFSSCEEVIDIDLNTSAPKLVIEATAVRFIDDQGATLPEGGVTVKLSTTTPFFDDGVNIVTNATVIITDANGITYPLTLDTNNHFTAPDFRPEEGVDYTLSVTYEGETFTATEQLQTVVPFEFVEQEEDSGFSGEETELRIYFTDPADVENYYYFQAYDGQGNPYDQDVFSDEFFDGNSIFVILTDEDLEPGDNLVFNLSGINEQFYNFGFVLLQQGSDDGGGPFETQPATVRGNILNTTNPDNFPLGYFRISEQAVLPYTVQ